MTEFLLIRHGETRFNAEGRFQGSLDSELSERGQNQARQLGRYLNSALDGAVHAWYSSPQGRALATSRLIRAEIKQPLPPEQIHENLREISCGTLEGQLHTEVPAGLLERIRNNPEQNYPEGESRLDVGRRALDFFNQNFADPLPEQSLVVVVAHGNLIQCLAAQLMDLEMHFSARALLENTGMVRLIARKQRRPFKLLTWNATPHLDESNRILR